MAIGKERRFYSEDKNKFLEDFCKQRLTYGNIEGNPEFKAGVCKLYKTIKLDEIIPTHGATGANHHVFYSLISPGERVISIRPTRNSTKNMRFFIVLRLLYLCFFAALSGDFMIPHGSLRF